MQYCLGMTRTEIIGNAVIMLMAGYDTSASSMMFLAYCLAVDPEVQEKVYQEVEESIKKHASFAVVFHTEFCSISPINTKH